MTSKIEFWRSSDWTMVYVDGVLERAGDHYLADEWLQERFGVVVVDDDAGFCIPDGHNAVRNLADVRAAQDEAAQRTARAEQLRKQAAEMLAEAAEIEGKR